MTREELRNYVDEQRALNNIPYHVYSTLIDGIDTLEQEPTTKIEESNFSSEQYLADIQSAYDCGKSVIDKIRAEIKTKYDCIPWRNNDYDDGWIAALEWVFYDVIDKYKAESEGNISKMGIVEEEENKEIEEYKEVTLEELLALKDKASWSGDTEDDEYQIYHVLPDYEPIKIKKSIVLEYLEKKDKENIHS